MPKDSGTNKCLTSPQITENIGHMARINITSSLPTKQDMICSDNIGMLICINRMGGASKELESMVILIRQRA